MFATEIEKLMTEHPESGRFSENAAFGSLLALSGVSREIGGPSDELSRLLICPESKETLSGELNWQLQFVQNCPAICISRKNKRRIILDHPTLGHYLHPNLGGRYELSFEQIIIVPEWIRMILSSENIYLAYNRQWADFSVLAKTLPLGLAKSKSIYTTNLWEMENLDVLRLLNHLKSRELAFLGTHDLVAHLAGATGEAMDGLEMLSKKALPIIESFSEGRDKKDLTLLVPYLFGVLLDDLAQPMFYGESNRLFALEMLLSLMRQWRPKPFHRQDFIPSYFAKIIECCRDPDCAKASIKGLIDSIVLSHAKLLS